MQDCGECTLCCKLPVIPTMNSPHGEYCRKCIPGVGCISYDDRPEECKVFTCAYCQMEKVNPKMRPDRCSIMFERISNNLMLGTVNGKINDLSDYVKGQISSFGLEGFSVMLQQFDPHRFVCVMVKGADRHEIIKALEGRIK